MIQEQIRTMSFISLCTIIVLCSFQALQSNAATNFSTYYYPLYGGDHLRISPDEVSLRFDQDSGAAFKSKSQYGSGLFHMRMKIPDKPTGGVATSFYLASAEFDKTRFELVMEYAGTNGTLVTKVYLNELNSVRVQTFNVWFNPSEDFHTYEYLWNSHQIVFSIDKIPIRVFRNNAAKGITYPTVPMQIQASVFNADWAGVVDWSKAPFVAHYQDFDVTACVGDSGCDSDKYFWNKPSYWDLSADDKTKMAQYRKQYMVYDYCSNPSTVQPECALNN